MQRVPGESAIIFNVPAVFQGPHCCCLLCIQVWQARWSTTLHAMLQLFGAESDGTRWMEKAVVQNHTGHPCVQFKHYTCHSEQQQL